MLHRVSLSEYAVLLRAFIDYFEVKLLHWHYRIKLILF